MNVIGRGSVSQIKTNGRYAIKMVNMDYHYIYIKELIVLRYLNVAVGNPYFPLLVDFEERNGTLVMEKFQLNIAQVMDSGCTEKTRIMICIHLLRAIHILHTAGIYHQSLSLRKMMTKFELALAGGHVPISIIGFGSSTTDKNGEAHDIYDLGVMILELISGNRMGKVSKDGVKERMKTIDSRFHNILNQMMSKRPEKRPKITEVMQALNVDAYEIKFPPVESLELKPPVFWLWKWMEKSIETLNLNIPIDTVFLTCVVCSITPVNDDPLMLQDNVYGMLYGCGVLFLYACLWNEVVSVDNFLGIIPLSFGMNRNIIFMYALDELIRNDGLMVMMIRGP